MAANHRVAGALLSLLAAAVFAGGCSSAPSEPGRKVVTPTPSAKREAPVSSLYTHAEAPLPPHENPLPPSPLLRPPAFVVKPVAQWSEQEIAADTIGRIGAAAVPALVQELMQGDAERRLRAIEVLARMGSDARDAVPQLTQMLGDPDERIRKAATRTLGRIGPEAAPAIPALMETLMQREPTPPPFPSPPSAPVVPPPEAIQPPDGSPSP